MKSIELNNFNNCKQKKKECLIKSCLGLGGICYLKKNFLITSYLALKSYQKLVLPCFIGFGRIFMFMAQN